MGLSYNFQPRTNFAVEFAFSIGCTLVLLLFVLVTALVERLKKESLTACQEEQGASWRRLPTLGSQTSVTEKKDYSVHEEALSICQKLCCYKENGTWTVAAIRFLLRPFQLLAEFLCVIWMLQIFRDDRDRVYQSEGCPTVIEGGIGGGGGEMSLHRQLSDCREQSEDYYISDFSDPRNFFHNTIVYIICYQLGSAALTLALDFHNPMHGLRSACYQLFGIRGVVQMYREIIEDSDSFEMWEYASLQALFFSYPMLLMITIYAFEAFQNESQGEWYLLMYFLLILSSINLARAINYRDHYGLIHKTLFQNSMLILVRMSEVYTRILVLAVFAAYVNKSLVFGYIGFMNVTHICYQLAQSPLFRASRCFCIARCFSAANGTSQEERSPQSDSTSNWLRAFVDVILTTIYNYLFFDILNEGFGMYMNFFKALETLTMIAILLIKNSSRFDVFEKEHSHLDLRLFFGLRIGPGILVLVISLIYFYCSGNFDFARYRNVTERKMNALIDVKAWEVIKSLIERREIEKLGARNADRIFAKLRDPTADGVSIKLPHLRGTLDFSIGDLCRLRVPMEKITPHIKWSHIKKHAIKMLEQNLKRNNAKAESSKPFPPNTDEFLKEDSENAAEASEADEQPADREDSASGKVSDLEEIISNDSESKAVSSIELTHMNKEKITPQQDPKANNKTSETSEEQKSVPQASTPEVNMSSGGVDSSNDSKPAKIQTHQTAAVPDQKQDKDVSKELTTENQASTDDKDSSICSCFRLLWPKGDEKQKDSKSSNQKKDKNDDGYSPNDILRPVQISNHDWMCGMDYEENYYAKTPVNMLDSILQHVKNKNRNDWDEDAEEAEKSWEDYKKNGNTMMTVKVTEKILEILEQLNIMLFLWVMTHAKDREHDPAEYRDYKGDADFKLFYLKCDTTFAVKDFEAKMKEGKGKVFHVLLKEETKEETKNDGIDSVGSDSVDPGLYIFEDKRESNDINLDFLEEIIGQGAQDDNFLVELRRQMESEEDWQRNDDLFTKDDKVKAKMLTGETKVVTIIEKCESVGREVIEQWKEAISKQDSESPTSPRLEDQPFYSVKGESIAIPECRFENIQRREETTRSKDTESHVLCRDDLQDITFDFYDWRVVGVRADDSESAKPKQDESCKCSKCSNVVLTTITDVFLTTITCKCKCPCTKSARGGESGKHSESKEESATKENTIPHLLEMSWAMSWKLTFDSLDQAKFSQIQDSLKGVLVDETNVLERVLKDETNFWTNVLKTNITLTLHKDQKSIQTQIVTGDQTAATALVNTVQTFVLESFRDKLETKCKEANVSDMPKLTALSTPITENVGLTAKIIEGDKSRDATIQHYNKDEDLVTIKFKDGHLEEIEWGKDKIQVGDIRVRVDLNRTYYPASAVPDDNGTYFVMYDNKSGPLDLKVEREVDESRFIMEKEHQTRARTFRDKLVPQKRNDPNYKVQSIELTTSLDEKYDEETGRPRMLLATRFEDQEEMMDFLTGKITEYEAAKVNFVPTSEKEELLSCNKCKEGGFFLLCCMPICAWASYRLVCCRGGHKYSATELIHAYTRDEKTDAKKFLVNDGDIFLASYASPESSWLSLSQGGQWGHCGIVFRYKEWMVEFLPKRFQRQMIAWKKRGIVKEGTPLVFEMTNHVREPDTNYHYGKDNQRKVHISQLQGWHFFKDAREYWGPLLGIRQYKGPRDVNFYKALFRTMHEHHLKPYEGVIFEFVCSGLCCYDVKVREEQLEKIFCSELVGEFHSHVKVDVKGELESLIEHGNPNDFQPSDYGSRKGPVPFGFICCCCLSYYIFKLLLCTDGRSTKEHATLKSNLGKLLILDTHSIQELEQQNEEDCTNFKEDQEDKEIKAIDLTWNLLNSHDNARRKRNEAKQQGIHDEIKNAMIKNADGVPGCEWFWVELTWWGFYTLTFIVPGLIIRLNYSRWLEDDNDGKEECQKLNRHKDFRHYIKKSLRQLIIICTGLFFGGFWALIFRLWFGFSTFRLYEVFVYFYFLGIVFVGCEGMEFCSQGWSKVYAHFYRHTFRLYGVHLGLQDNDQKLSELLSPVKIPFITVITLSISLIVVCIADTLGYHAERLDFSKHEKPKYPMYFVGSLAGILFLMYKFGRYVIRSAVGRETKLLMALGARSRYQKHEMFNEIAEYQKLHARLSNEREKKSKLLPEKEFQNLKDERKILIEDLEDLAGLECEDDTFKVLNRIVKKWLSKEKEKVDRQIEQQEELKKEKGKQKEKKPKPKEIQLQRKQNHQSIRERQQTSFTLGHENFAHTAESLVRESPRGANGVRNGAQHRLQQRDFG